MNPGSLVGRGGLLRRGPVLRLTVAGTLSEIGDWMLLIALPLVVLQATGSSLVTATVFALELVPSIVIGPFVGVLVDRFDPWRLMAGVALVQAICLAPLALVDGSGGLPIVYAVVVVEAALGTVIEPARTATAAAIVPLDDVATVNQTMAVTSSIARLVGAPLGGVALAFGGLPAVVVADAITFVVVAALLVRRGPRMRRDASEPITPVGLLLEWWQGVGIVRRSATLRRLAVVLGLMALAQGGFVVLFVLFVVRDLGADETAVGLLRGIQAVGAIAGGLLLVVIGHRLRAGALVAGALLVFALLTLAIWNAPLITTALPVYVMLFAVVGAPGVAVTTGVLTIAQRVADPRARGRVLALLFAVEGALQALGMLLAGLLGTGAGLTAGLEVQAALYLVAGLIALGLRNAVPFARRSAASPEPADAVSQPGAGPA